MRRFVFWLIYYYYSYVAIHGMPTHARDHEAATIFEAAGQLSRKKQRMVEPKSKHKNRHRTANYLESINDNTRYQCVLHDRPFFPPVDIQQTQCPCRLFLLERYKLCGHKTTTDILRTMYR